MLLDLGLPGDLCLCLDQVYGEATDELDPTLGQSR